MAVVVDRDMERVFGQLHEVQKRLLNGSLLPLAVRQPLQDIIEGKFVLDNRFAQFKPYLLDPVEQLKKIEDFNDRFWHNDRVGVQADTWLLAKDSVVNITRDHVQIVDDLLVLYVDFGSPEATLEAWWQVIAATQPNAWRWDGLISDAEHLRLGPNSRQYEPGIHMVRIDLTAHWEPEDGRSIQDVRQQAVANDELLAHAEVLAAYGLHDELLRQMDGQNLPFADLAGYEATAPGFRPWASVPYLRWGREGREIYLYADWDGSVSCRWAAPVVRES